MKKLNKEEVIKSYMGEKMSVLSMTKKFNVSYRTMVKTIGLLGLSVRGRISSNPYLADKSWLLKKYIDEKKSVGLIAKECGSTRGNVYSSLKFAKIPIRTMKEGVALLQRMGSTAGHWKGGRRLAGANGRYIQILTHGHPHANHDGYVMEHILIMEEKIGRHLTKDEIIHHLDGNGHNNNLENLQLTTRKKHFENHFDAVKELKDATNEVSRLKSILDEHHLLY